jgi:hypothetical protein
MQQLLANANQDLLTRMEVKIDADRNADREALDEMSASTRSDRKQMLTEISARMDKNSKEINAKMEANQAEMRSKVCAFRSELEETIQHEIKSVIQPIRSELDEDRLQRSDRD